MRLSIFLLGLLAYGCASKENWKSDHIQGAKPQFSSHRLSYRSTAYLNPMHFEIIRKDNSYKGYLFVQQTPIPPHAQNPDKALIFVEIDGISSPYIVNRYQDGYRLLLSNELLDTLILSLSNEKSISIQASKYTTFLSSEGFIKQYEQFQKNPSISKLIQSPF